MKTREERNAYKRAWDKRNPDRVRQYKKNWEAKYPDKAKLAKQKHERSRRERGKNRWKEMNRKAKQRAIRHGVQWENVDYYQLYTERPEHCPECGLSTKGLDLLLDVDHILPLSSGGSHTRDNVQVIHMWCHRMKTEADRLGLNKQDMADIRAQIRLAA